MQLSFHLVLPDIDFSELDLLLSPTLLKPGFSQSSRPRGPCLLCVLTWSAKLQTGAMLDCRTRPVLLPCFEAPRIQHILFSSEFYRIQRKTICITLTSLDLRSLFGKQNTAEAIKNITNTMELHLHVNGSFSCAESSLPCLCDEGPAGVLESNGLIKSYGLTVFNGPPVPSPVCSESSCKNNQACICTHHIS